LFKRLFHNRLTQQSLKHSRIFPGGCPETALIDVSLHIFTAKMMIRAIPRPLEATPERLNIIRVNFTIRKLPGGMIYVR
jgi:hypothetical protein